MRTRLCLVGATLLLIAIAFVGGRCSAPPCPDPDPCPPCPDCRLVQAAADPTVPLAPLVEERWSQPCSP